MQKISKFWTLVLIAIYFVNGLLAAPGLVKAEGVEGGNSDVPSEQQETDAGDTHEEEEHDHEGEDDHEGEVDENHGDEESGSHEDDHEGEEHEDEEEGEHEDHDEEDGDEHDHDEDEEGEEHEGEGETHEGQGNEDGHQEEDHDHDHEENEDHEEHDHEDGHQHEDEEHAITLEKVGVNDAANNCSAETVRYLADLEPGTYTLGFSSSVSELLTLVIEQFASHDHDDDHDHDHGNETEEDHEEGDDHDHEGEDHEGEEHEHDEEALAELDEHACLHQAFGEPEVLEAAADHETADSIDVSAPHTRYDITLPEGEGGYAGFVSFQVDEDAEYSFYLSADVEFEILTEDHEEGHEDEHEEGEHEDEHEDDDHEEGDDHDHEEEGHEHEGEEHGDDTHMEEHNISLERVAIDDVAGNCSAESVRYLADLEPGTYTLGFSSSASNLLTLVIEQFAAHDHEDHEGEGHEGHDHEDEYEDGDHGEEDVDAHEDEDHEGEHEEGEGHEDHDHGDEDEDEEGHDREHDEDEHDENEHEEEALAELDGHACLHQAFGEPEVLEAATSHEEAAAVDVSDPHTRYDLTLPESEDGYTGYVTFQVEEDAEYSFYLSTDVEFEILTEDHEEEDNDHDHEHEDEEHAITLEKVGVNDAANNCSAETVRYLADLEPGTYTLGFSSSVSELLTLVIEQFASHDHEGEESHEGHDHGEEDHEDHDDHDHEDEDHDEDEERDHDHDHDEEEGDTHEDDHDHEEEGHEHEGEEHEHDEETLAELDEHACLHQAFGEPTLLDAAADHETAVDVDVSAPHTRYDLTLPEDEEEGYIGFASFQVEEDAEYSFYLSTDVAFEILTEDHEDGHDHENETEEEGSVDTAGSQGQGSNNNSSSGGSANQANNSGVGGQPLSHNPQLDEHACLHVNHGPERAVISSATTATAPDVSRAHTRFDITLPGGGSNFVKYIANEDIDYVFYLTNNVPFSILDNGGQAVSIAAYGEPVQNCPAAVTKHLTRLTNGTYYLEFTPSGPSSVSLVVEKSEVQNESQNNNQQSGSNDNQAPNNNPSGGGNNSPVVDNSSDTTTSSTPSTVTSTTTPSTPAVEESASSNDATEDAAADGGAQTTEAQSATEEQTEEQTATTDASASGEATQVETRETSSEGSRLTQGIEEEGSEQETREPAIENVERDDSDHGFEGEVISAADDSAPSSPIDNVYGLPIVMASIGSIGLFFAIRLILL